MKKRTAGWILGAVLAACLYFFENGTATRILLYAVILLPLIPPARKALFAPDREAEKPRLPRREMSRGTFSLPSEEDAGDVRAYMPGDPVNRIHWKLSAKKDETLVRAYAREETTEERREETAVSGTEGGTGNRSKRFLFYALAVLLPLAALIALPFMRESAQALFNRLFAASEAVNAYAYTYFSVPEGQPVWPAALLLALTFGAAVWAAVSLRSRGLMLGIAALAVFGQVYFGLTLPGWMLIGLFVTLCLWTAGRPVGIKGAAAILAVILACATGTVLLRPGTDVRIEEASESVRDAMSRAAGQMAGTLRETPDGETETRHIHSRSMKTGEDEGRAEKEYRLVNVEEEQISAPYTAEWLKAALYIIAAAVLMILPFLPFMWLNARKKKALEAREAFMSENVSEAVCAIFQHVIRWLEETGRGQGNMIYSLWKAELDGSADYAEKFRACEALFEEAAYSEHALREEDREQVLKLLEETEETLKARAGWKQRLTLKYRKCLWV